MDTKVCSTCGQEKRVDDFRKYYGGRKGQYSFCKECEKIEQRRKYLCRLETLTELQSKELSAIEQLYAKRSEAGLKVPGQIRSKTGVDELIAKQMEVLNNGV